VATITVYPDPSTGATTVDGIVDRESVDESFSTIRAGAGTLVDAGQTVPNLPYIQSTTTSNQYQRLRRGIYTFDTSAIGAGAAVTGATLSIYGTSQFNGLGNPDLHVAAATPAANNTLDASDYSNVGNTSFGSVTYAGYNTGGYNDITLNSSGMANINTTGISRFCTRLSWDMLNDTTGLVWGSNKQSYFVNRMADFTGTTADPKLTVTYNPAFLISTSESITVSESIYFTREYKDQRQNSETTNAGFGEFSFVRYRGQSFTAAFATLTAIGFQMISQGSKGLKVYLYAADSSGLPTGSELYSFVIANAQVSTSFKQYRLPVAQTLTPGNRYCFYLAPWDTSGDAYSDDYRDLRHVNSSTYSSNYAIVNNNGTWSQSDSGDLDMWFETYGRPPNLTGNTRATLYPTATGVTNSMDSAQGSGSPASKLIAIQETAVDDGVSYIYDPTSSTEEFFNLSDSQIPAASNIHRVRVHLRWKGVDPVDADCQIAVYIGSTKYYSNSKETRKQTDYRDDYYDWETNPNSGVLWTIADIDNLQIGIKNTNAVGKQFSQLYAVVDYVSGYTASVSDSITVNDASPTVQVESPAAPPEIANSENITVSENVAVAHFFAVDSTSFGYKRGVRITTPN
jgi:hypothetical protein